MNLDSLKDLMKSYGMKHLARDAGVSRTSLYNLLQGANFESSTLEKVSRILNVEFGLLCVIPTLETVCNYLAFYNAPLHFDKRKLFHMTLEDTLKWGIYYSESNGILESILPYVLVLNFHKLNISKLFAQLDKESQLQLLGYYLDIAGDYSKSKKMHDLADSFYSDQLSPLTLGKTKPTQRLLDVIKYKKNTHADKWKILTLNSSNDYFDRFRKWDKVV